MRRTLSTDSLLDMERTKRSARMRRYWQDRREAARVEKSGAAYREVEAAGQRALDFTAPCDPAAEVFD